MAEALAKIGGMVDARSDPDSVFVFRMEDAETARKIGINTEKLGNQRIVPVIYRAKLRDPSGLFVTASFVCGIVISSTSQTRILWNG